MQEGYAGHKSVWRECAGAAGEGEGPSGKAGWGEVESPGPTESVLGQKELQSRARHQGGSSWQTRGPGTVRCLAIQEAAADSSAP